jgi:hypothetical protein
MGQRRKFSAEYKREAVAKETLRDPSSGNPQSSAVGLYRDGPQHQIGHGYHLHSDRRALVISMCCAGFVFGPRGGVVDECTTGPPAGGASRTHGVMAATRPHPGYSALGSGLSVYVRGVPTLLGGPSHYRQYECRGELCGQCRCGEVLWGAQTGTGESATLPDKSGSKSGYLRLHRTVLQCTTAAETGMAASGRETLNSTVRGNGVEPIRLPSLRVC